MKKIPITLFRCDMFRSGRAGRREFWSFTSGSFLLLTCGTALGQALFPSAEHAVRAGAVPLVLLLLLLPRQISVIVRRLHDAGVSTCSVLLRCLFLALLPVVFELALQNFGGELPGAGELGILFSAAYFVLVLCRRSVSKDGENTGEVLLAKSEK